LCYKKGSAQGKCIGKCILLHVKNTTMQTLPANHLLRWFSVICLRSCAVLALLSLGLGLVHAVPVLDLRAQDLGAQRVDLRAHWQSARALAPQRAESSPLEAQTLWSQPDAQFAMGQEASLRLQAGERWVGRLALYIPAAIQGLVIDLPMPRLDAAHLSYRYDSGPWTHLMAGDKIPMVQWPFANRSPVFPIPAQAGQLQVVLDIAHHGLLVTPVYVQRDTAFFEQRFDGALRTGALLGLSAVVALVSLGAAGIFRRASFLTVALMTLCVGIAVFCQGGVAGMYLGTHSAVFNDLSKFVTGMLCAAVLPWTIATVASQKFYSRRTWQLAQLWLAVGVLAGAAMVAAGSRSVQAASLVVFLPASAIFALGLALASLWRRQAHSHWTVVAVLSYGLGVGAPLVAYWGHADGAQSFVLSGLGFLLSTLLLLYVLVLQHRHGRMVTTRAKTAVGRDVLTGLLNRQGFEQTLARKLRRAGAPSSPAVFLYIAVSDAQTLQEFFGDEGFEVGMVQMAAAITSCASGEDAVARVAPNAFALAVAMPHEPARASALAQKIITRILALASHGALLAPTARIAIDWLPAQATPLAEMELRALEALDGLEAGKRIGWAPGAQAQQMAGGAPPPYADSRGMPGVISRLRHDMLGPDTEQLKP
jgi:GGDEF domain-containing protein